jgi:putative effector of murein hydrolase
MYPMKHITENYDNYNKKIIPFKPFLEPNLFDIAIKIYKQKCGVTSSVVMAISKQCIVGKYLCNKQHTHFTPFIYFFFNKGNKKKSASEYF